MKTLSLLEVKHKLKTQDIFRGKTVRELVDHIDQQAARIAELEAYVEKAEKWFNDFGEHAPIHFGGEYEMATEANDLLIKGKRS